ncbi:MAG: DUF1365 family protein, partial [Devosia sp.]
PKSRGRLYLAGPDADTKPRIEANYLGDEAGFDLRMMRECVRLSRELIAQPAFAPYRGEELFPGERVRDEAGLDAFIRRKAAAAGVMDVARIRMLAYPRLFGFAFNPITVYFCEDAAGVTSFMAYEVSNTFGEHHFYQAAVQPSGDQIRHEAKKAFYVSPFNTLEGAYRFSVRPPAETVFLGITLSDAEGGLLTAYFEGEQRPLTDATLLKLLLAYPFMTAKVVAGIHWEALLLWLKGVPPTLKLRRQSKRRREV